MRARRAAQEQVAEVARRRLELLSAELAEVRAAVRPQTEGRPADGEPADVKPPGEEPLQPAQPLAEVLPGRHARRSAGARMRVAGWLSDRLPPTLQGRVGLAGEHLTVIAVLVAVALGATAWWVLRADPPGQRASASAPAGPEPSSIAVVDAEADAAGPDGPAASSPASSPSGGGDTTSSAVVVDVAGKVRRPGIASLPTGSRVVDALAAAGGARRSVDLTSLNLARVLVDGEQIVVGLRAPGGVAAPALAAPGAAQPSSALINVNTASQAELEELPGVGPVTAGAIIQWRSEHGAFTAVDELLEVSGIGDVTLAEIAPHVTL